MNPKSVTLAILAGGAGSRMGTPKSLLTVRGRPILDYLHRRFAWPGPTLLVTTPGRERPPGSELYSKEATDPVAEEGPLRGLLTAIEECTTPLLVVSTVDMPCTTATHFQFLIEAMERRPGCTGLMLRREVNDVGLFEPFPSIFRAGARDAASSLLAADERSVRALLGQPDFADIPAPKEWPPRTWTNLNYPEDLERFLREPP